MKHQGFYTVCPRKGDTRDFPVPRLDGASITITFAGPAVGRQYAKRLADLVRVDSARINEQRAATTQEASPHLWREGYFTADFLIAYYAFAKDVLLALAVGVNGVRGFEPEKAEEMHELCEYLSAMQIAEVMAEALRWQQPALSDFVGASKYQPSID